MQKIILSFIFMSSICLTAANAGDIAAGRAKSATCVACHQADGNSAAGIYPKIAGQHESYMIKQMLEIQKGEVRESAIMLPMIQGLSQKDIEDLSAFYASQKVKPGVVQEKYLQLGKKIYRGGNLESGVPACTGCHSPAGAGNALAKFPALAGQHAEYTIDQLKKFASGERRNSPNRVMHDIAKKLTDEEMVAVAHFIMGLESE